MFIKHYVNNFRLSLYINNCRTNTYIVGALIFTTKNERQQYSRNSFTEEHRTMVLLFLYIKLGVSVMMTTLKCEKCDRPAQLKEQATGRTRNGNLNVKKVYERVFSSGGKFKLLME